MSFFEESETRRERVAWTVGGALFLGALLWLAISMAKESLSGELIDAGTFVSADFAAGALFSSDVMTIRTTTGVYLITGRYSFSNGTHFKTRFNRVTGNMLCWSEAAGDVGAMGCAPLED